MFVSAATPGSRGRKLWQLILVAVLLALAATAVALPILGSGDEDARGAVFSADGEGRLGFVDLAERRGATVSTLLTGAYLLEDLEEPSTALVVVSRLDRAPAQGEIDAFASFVARGGTLLVATHEAHASALGARFGVDVDGHPVLSSATGAAPELSTPAGSTLRLAPLTALHVSPDAGGVANVLLTTSRQSFLDLNRDGRIDGFDRDGPFVAGVSIEREGQGRALFFGSAALLENRGLDDDATRALVEALLEEAVAPGSRVVLYEGATAQALQPLATTMGIMESATRHPVARPVVALGLPLAAVLVAWRYPGPPKLEHVYAGAAERHRDIEKERMKAGLRELIIERARERAGLTMVEFEALNAADRRAFIEATISSLLSGSTTEARALAALHLFDEG